MSKVLTLHSEPSTKITTIKREASVVVLRLAIKRAARCVDRVAPKHEKWIQVVCVNEGS